MNGLDKIFNRIDGYRAEIIGLQEELTSRPALGPDNGGTGEHEKCDYIKELMKDLAPDTFEEVRAPDERAMHGYRPNLLALWGARSSGPVVWVLSHSDVVPPGDPSLWDGDPYKLRVENDRLMGRGVEDNQQGFVSSYLALKAIIESGIQPAFTVGLAVVADEETGSKYGLQYVLENRQALFRQDDYIVVPDVGSEDGTMIEVAEKSMLWLRFTVRGRQCHASAPDKGRNSFSGVARLVVELEGLRRKFDSSDTLFRLPSSTFEPTKVEANVPNINTIPGKDVFHLDCRILPCYRVDEIIDSVRKSASGIGSELGLEIDVETVHCQQAAEQTPSDAPVVKALSEAVRRVTGRQAVPMGIGGGTVAAFFREAGLPVAVWCTIQNTAHQPNECCLISNIMTDAKVFACLYMNSFITHVG